MSENELKGTLTMLIVIMHFHVFLNKIIHSQVQGEGRVGTLGVQGKPPEKNNDRHPVC